MAANKRSQEYRPPRRCLGARSIASATGTARSFGCGVQKGESGVRKVYICSLQHFYAVNGLRKVPGEFEPATSALCSRRSDNCCAYSWRVWTLTSLKLDRIVEQNSAEERSDGAFHK